MLTFGAPRRIRTSHGTITETYYVRIHDRETGKRWWKTTGATSLRAAELRRRELEIEASQTGAGITDFPFEKALEEWLLTKEPKISPRGLLTYKGYIKSWKRRIPGRVAVRRITPAQFEAYFRLRAAEVSGTTLNKERATLRQFTRYARDRKWTASDFSATIQRHAEPSREIRTITPEEEAAILRCAREPYKLSLKRTREDGTVDTWDQDIRPPWWLHGLVYLAIRTGMRRGSLLALRWSDIDLNGAMLRVDAERMKAKADFSLPLDADTVAYLRDMRRSATGLSLFPSCGNFATVWRNLCKRAGITRKLRFHDLRASFISRACERGVPVEIVQRLAAHKRLETTVRFYRHIREEELRAAMDRIGAPAVPPRGKAKRKEA